MSKFLDIVDELLSGTDSRFIQDTPVYPSVWRMYAKIAESKKDSRNQRQCVLLSAHRDASSSDLMCELIVRLYEFLGERVRSKDDWLDPYEIGATDSHVAVRLTFTELACVVLPLTPWWQRFAAVEKEGWKRRRLSLEKFLASEEYAVLPESLAKTSSGDHELQACLTNSGRWLFHILGLIWWRLRAKNYGNIKRETCIENAFQLLKESSQAEPKLPLLWGISENRPVKVSMLRSIPAVKADAANLLFNPDSSQITWAIVDSGIDATHPAFAIRNADGESKRKPFVPSEDGTVINNTRVIETYDFTRMRGVLAIRSADLGRNIAQMPGTFDEKAKSLRNALVSGRMFDWETLLDKLRVDYDPQDWEASIPNHEHGTHVAGIIGADWPENGIKGVCPGIRFYDLRVVDQDGIGDEFSTLAALSFIRYKNANSDRPIIQGVNISMSIKHDVRNYACGRTPVCEECDRIVSSGVVVVAAAGNQGYAQFVDLQGTTSGGYRSAGITDPGNCESVITVGATHRFQPFRYGVSYFSSRGPTGDGRMKPDLVAPGEKINSTVPREDTTTMDGTSMAAPHVSGAAALLMARYSELIGEPTRIKQILCSTATDLGRERDHQGAGMLDILRALQAV